MRTDLPCLPLTEIEITMQMTEKRKNVILVGMPGCGKSTIGILAAKVLCLSFLDTDILLQQNARRSLQDIINGDGLEAFRRLERDLLSSISVEHTLVATGGSAVYYEDAMEHLRSIGKVVYLRSSLQRIKEHLRDYSQRGIVMPLGMTIDDLFRERVPLYERYAHLTVDVDEGRITDNMHALVEAVRSSDW